MYHPPFFITGIYNFDNKKLIRCWKAVSRNAKSKIMNFANEHHHYVVNLMKQEK